MQNTMNIAASARVWVYMSDRKLSESETAFAQSEIDKFTAQWAAHGKPLAASGEIKHHQFVVLMVDEAYSNASGCSIDSSVHFMQQLGRQLNVDFFNRLLMAYQATDGSIQTIRQANLEEAFQSGQITLDTIVFNNLVATKAALDAEWQVPLKDSFYKRLV
jgi:hypothetical protein